VRSTTAHEHLIVRLCVWLWVELAQAGRRPHASAAAGHTQVTLAEHEDNSIISRGVANCTAVHTIGIYITIVDTYS